MPFCAYEFCKRGVFSLPKNLSISQNILTSRKTIDCRRRYKYLKTYLTSSDFAFFDVGKNTENQL